ncbi:MAG: universal stress protein [Verrucomicrobiota bacterium]
MTETQPIIAAIDYSQSSPSVLHHSLNVSAHNGAPVIVLNVLEEARSPWGSKTTSEDPESQKLISKGTARLEERIKQHPSVTLPKIEIRIGHPGKEIQSCVEEHGASLLVIAANDTNKSRLGAIASRCVRSSPCDVLVLRRKQRGNFRKIVVCADFSATSSLALIRAIGIALKEGSSLQIVHAIYPPDIDIWGEVLEHKIDSKKGYREACRERIKNSMTNFLCPHQTELSQLDHETIILESRLPAAAITNYVTEAEANLVVMGTRGRSPFMSHFLGTNAERLMQDSPVSVLAVRDAKF